MSLAIREEPWERMEPEFRGLVRGHWEEVGEPFPLEFDWDLYRAGCIAVAARDEGVLVGYIVGRISSHPYLGGGIGSADLYYLLPSHRRGFAGADLVRAFEDVLRERGARMVYLGVSLRHDHGALLRYLNYKPVDTYYSKEL